MAGLDFGPFITLNVRSQEIGPRSGEAFHRKVKQPVWMSLHQHQADLSVTRTQVSENLLRFLLTTACFASSRSQLRPIQLPHLHGSEAKHFRIGLSAVVPVNAVARPLTTAECPRIWSRLGNRWNIWVSGTAASGARVKLNPLHHRKSASSPIRKLCFVFARTYSNANAVIARSLQVKASKLLLQW